MKVFEGNLKADTFNFAIVVGRFNEFICKSLLDGAVDCLVRHGVKRDNLAVVWVPGAFEVPLASKVLAKKKDIDAVISLGALIRGATPHFDFIASAATGQLAAIASETGKPVAFGILTTDTIEQAIERAGTKSGNKGWEAAAAAIEMLNVLKAIK